jgi:hypothetical protein
MRLTPGRALTLTAVAVLALAATAVAVKPKPGAYSGRSDNKNVSLNFEDGEIVNFVASRKACKEGAPAIIDKEIKVKESGKFNYDGKAHGLLTGDNFHAELEGKFVSKKKAKGTFHRDGCDEQKFKAKYVNTAG